MRFKTLIIIFIISFIVFITFLIFQVITNSKTEPMKDNISTIKLPAPQLISQISVEQAINQRKSIREYQKEPLSLSEVSQLLWSAQGLNSSGSRVAPSAGALYPLEIYLVVKNVEGLAPGVYHYLSDSHSLEYYLNKEIDEVLAKTAYDQEWVEKAPLKIIISGIFQRTTKKYSQRGILYVYQESGHVAQNIYLQAVSLNLGTVSVGGFDQTGVDELLNFSEGQNTLYIMPVGKIK